MQFQINNGKTTEIQRNLSEGKINHIVLGMVYSVYLRKPYVPLHSCIGNWTTKQTPPF